MDMKPVEDLKEIKIDIDKKMDILERKYELENSYKLCCGSMTDRRLVEYGSKVLIIFSILVFSMIQIFHSNNTEERTVFIIVLNTILSVFLPSPTIAKKNTSKEVIREK